MEATSMKNRIISFALTIVFIALLIPAIGVNANSRVVVDIDGQQVTFPDASPIIVEGRTLVPVRAVFEALDFVVSWNPDTRTATMTRGTDTIIITVGSATFTTNGVTRALDVLHKLLVVAQWCLFACRWRV
jgi:hypothetical protein